MNEVIDSLRKRFGPDGPPATGAEFNIVRRYLAELERATADRLPFVDVVDLVRGEYDPVLIGEVNSFSAHYSFINVLFLREDREETWCHVDGGPIRYEVRDAGEEDGEPVYAVWDTHTDKRVPDYGDDLVPSYDRTDKADTQHAATHGNRANYRATCLGWPFSNHYAPQIVEFETADFAACGFVVMRHLPSDRLFAGIDRCNGPNPTRGHWLPLYLRKLVRALHLFGPEHPVYVRTEAGLRRLVDPSGWGK